jgi:hypothetical protein
LQILFTVFEDGSSYLSSFLETLGMTEETAQTLATYFINLSNSVMEFLQPIVDNIVNFVSFQDILTAIGIAIAAVVIPAVVSLMATLLPLIATFAAIVAAVALVRQVWENDFMGIRTALEEFWNNTAQPALSQLQTWLQTNLPIAIQFLTDYWNTVLLPALQAFWAWANDVLFPLLTTFVEWLQTNIPLAIQFLTDMWNNTLLPALQAVWEFINNSVVPVWQALADLLNAAVSLAITAVVGLWNEQLWPALEKIWLLIQDKLMPIFDGVATKLNGPVSNAISTFKGWIDDLWTSLGGLEGIFSSVVGWIEEMTAALGNAKLPDWMTPGSPTPWEIGLRGVNSAFRELNTGAIPEFRQNMAAMNNNVSTRQTNLTLNMYSSAPRESVMQDFNLMRAVSGGSQ